MSTPTENASVFLRLHHEDRPLLLPNAWDAGSARLLSQLGFRALATTSSGFAATLGRFDSSVTRSEALQHSADIVASTVLPVSADLENGFGHTPDEVAETVAEAAQLGLAGCSIEDFTIDEDTPIYDGVLAHDRVVAAVAAAHEGPRRLVLTARCENFLHGRNDLGETIARLQSYQSAGADVLYAPGVIEASDIASIVQNVDLPVNVLSMPGGLNADQLAELGVKRISVGGALAFAAYGSAMRAAREWIDTGSVGFYSDAAVARELMPEAFAD